MKDPMKSFGSVHFRSKVIKMFGESRVVSCDGNC